MLRLNGAGFGVRSGFRDSYLCPANKLLTPNRLRFVGRKGCLGPPSAEWRGHPVSEGTGLGEASTRSFMALATKAFECAKRQNQLALAYVAIAGLNGHICNRAHRSAAFPESRILAGSTSRCTMPFACPAESTSNITASPEE